MQFSSTLRKTCARARVAFVLLAGAAFAPPVFVAHPAHAQDSSIEEIVVTARKREETIQDIPIAINAFGTEDIAANQIGDVSDLQLNVPNVTYTKTNFSGAGSFSIRGIGTLVVATSSDLATGVHVNTAPVQGARIFETEFFDTERIEILRGPQGTLYGRNASAGLINIITREAEEEVGGYFTVEAGDYEHFRGETAVSIPLSDTLRVRVAAYGLHRAGYTENLSSGNDIDDRALWGIRGTLSGELSEDTDFKLMVSWFEEDDNRMRISNQGCTRDESPYPFNIGCVGGVQNDVSAWTSSLSYQLMQVASLTHFGNVLGSTVMSHAAALVAAGIDPTMFNPATDIVALATFAGTPGTAPTDAAAAAAAAAALGAVVTPGGPGNYGFLNPNPFLSPGESGDLYRDSTRPADLRQVNVALDPIYETYEFLATLEINHRFGDYQFASVSAVRSSLLSDSLAYGAADPSHAFAGPRPSEYAVADEPTCSGNERYFSFPGSPFDRSGCSEYEYGFDWARARNQLWTSELRVASEYEGPFNFTLGVSYLRNKVSTDYGVYTTALEEFGRFQQVGAESDCAEGGNADLCGVYMAREAGVNPLDQTPQHYDPSLFSIYAQAPEQTYFNSRTHPYELDAYAGFGEAYYDVERRLRFTLGVRWTRDEKEATATGGCLFGNGCDTLTQFAEWDEVTGKVGVDWNASENTLLYAVASRGFKGGGFNPGQDPDDPRDLSATFEPEEIDAFEIGSKSTFFDGALTVNTSAFFYDYAGFQVAKIVNRTAINENIDAEVLGVEVEAYWFPLDNLSFDFAFAYLDTEITGGTSIDTTDPADGKGVALKSPALSASNAVIATEGLSDAEIIAQLRTDCAVFFDLAMLQSATFPATLPTNTCVNPAYRADLGEYLVTLQTYATTNGVTLEEAGMALAAQGTLPIDGTDEKYAMTARGSGTTYASGGIPTILEPGFEKDLTGRKLPNAPEFTVKVGATWALDLGQGWAGTARVNYYWQDDMYGRIFNEQRDVIEAWEQVNAQFSFTNPESPWTLTLWAKNLTDEDAITGHYFTDESSGNFTNLFILDPRTYGVTLRYVFGSEAR